MSTDCYSLTPSKTAQHLLNLKNLMPTANVVGAMNGKGDSENQQPRNAKEEHVDDDSSLSHAVNGYESTGPSSEAPLKMSAGVKKSASAQVAPSPPPPVSTLAKPAMSASNPAMKKSTATAPVKPSPPPRVSSIKTASRNGSGSNPANNSAMSPQQQQQQQPPPLQPYQPRPSTRIILDSYAGVPAGESPSRQRTLERSHSKPTTNMATDQNSTITPQICTWAENFQNLLTDPIGFPLFHSYIKKADKALALTLDFYFAVGGLREEKSMERKRKMFHIIYNHFIVGTEHIKIDRDTINRMVEQYQEVLHREKHDDKNNNADKGHEMSEMYHSFFNEALQVAKMELGSGPYYNFMENIAVYFHNRMHSFAEDDNNPSATDEDSNDPETSKSLVSSDEANNNSDNKEQLATSNNHVVVAEEEKATTTTTTTLSNPAAYIADDCKVTKVAIPVDLVSKLASSKPSIEVGFFPPNATAVGNVSSGLGVGGGGGVNNVADGGVFSHAGTVSNTNTLVSDYRRAIDKQPIFPYNVKYSTVVHNSKRETEVSSSGDSYTGIGGHGGAARVSARGQYLSHQRKVHIDRMSHQNIKNRHLYGVDPTKEVDKFAELIIEKLNRFVEQQGSEDRISEVLARCALRVQETTNAGGGGVGGVEQRPGGGNSETSSSSTLKELLKKRPIPTMKIDESDQTILDKHVAQVFETPNSGTPTGQPYNIVDSSGASVNSANNNKPAYGYTSGPSSALGGMPSSAQGTAYGTIPRSGASSEMSYAHHPQQQQQQHHHHHHWNGFAAGGSSGGGGQNPPLEQTIATISFSNEQCPYKLKLDGVNITLACFKVQCASLLNKQSQNSTLSYFFKRDMTEEEKRESTNGAVHMNELISDDSAVLPTCNGKIMASINVL